VFQVRPRSRKEALVDRIGDMSSIFEKIRFQLRSIPRQFWPVKFDEDNMSFMRIFAASGESITGESGDDIGRGGRTLIYFKDESAHYEHPESIEAALSDNTRVQIDISSVNGLGNVFHRKREGGVE
jgi:phage terminase large subunit